MKFTPLQPPRLFEVGVQKVIQFRDYGCVELEENEQITFTTDSGAEYDIARKNWGFYATPSLNGRLKKFGLRGLLVKSPGEKFYVFLVEQGREGKMQDYLEEEGHHIVCWLDSDIALQELERRMTGLDLNRRCLCGSEDFSETFVYTSPPEGEIRFRFSSSSSYKRTVVKCGNCGHFLSLHTMDAGPLYTGEYVDSTYSSDGLRKAYDRIMSLPPEKSDNTGRVKRIAEFANSFLRISHPSILDVGSGLCVFLARMKEAGWLCTALDPDSRAAEHASKVVGIEAINDDFMTTQALGVYDVITFNKVLEHVQDPVAMLAKISPHVRADGFIYIELPDGESAAAEGQGREEFFIDHWHVFSAASVAHLAKKSGFQLIQLERLREPSTKYTLRAFLKPSLEKQ